MSYDANHFEVNYIDHDIIELISDFNETFYQNSSTDCLLIIAILYIGTQLIGLKDFMNEFKYTGN